MECPLRCSDRTIAGTGTTLAGLDYPQAQITFTKGTAMAEEHWFDR